MIRLLGVRFPYKKGGAVLPFMPSTVRLIIPHKPLFCIIAWLCIWVTTMDLNAFQVQITICKTPLNIKVLSGMQYLGFRILLVGFVWEYLSHILYPKPVNSCFVLFSNMTYRKHFLGSVLFRICLHLIRKSYRFWMQGSESKLTKWLAYSSAWMNRGLA